MTMMMMMKMTTVMIMMIRSDDDEHDVNGDGDGDGHSDGDTDDDDSQEDHRDDFPGDEGGHVHNDNEDIYEPYGTRQDSHEVSGCIRREEHTCSNIKKPVCGQTAFCGSPINSILLQRLCRKSSYGRFP